MELMILKTTCQKYFDEYSDEKYDIIILGLGNEKRNSIEIIEKINNKYKHDYCIALCLEKRNLELSSLLNRYNNQFIIINIDNSDLLELGFTNLISLLEKNKEVDLNIYINVAGIDREELLMILKLLVEYKNIKIKVTYISCVYGDYLVEEYCKPENIKFFEGNPMLSAPIAMILMAGYEKNAAKILINYFQPIKLFIGLGQEPLEPGQELPERITVKEIVDDYTINPDMEIVQFDYNASDPDKTYSALLNLEKEYELDLRYNLLLASTTTKLATIGMFLYCEEHPNAQFVYTKGKTKNDLSLELLNIYEYEFPERYKGIYEDKI
jgi:hypothetical protein